MQSTTIYPIRNAGPEDFSYISKLFLGVRTQYFGWHRRKDNLEDIFFNKYVAHRMLIQFSATNSHNIGYAEVGNAPNIPALPDDLWLDFLNFHYCYNLPLNPTNTCFLNKFVYNDCYNPAMLKQLLCEIFYRENKLRYIVVAECPDYRRYPKKDIRNYSCLKDFSMVFYPKCFSVKSCANTQKLHVIMRYTVLPPMRYRRALPEDNDDLVDVINQDRPELKELWGDYYIAEELLSESKSLLIVIEILNITVGFIWLNDNINLLHLLENYNLQSFGNLLKFNTQERFKEKLIYVTTAKKRSLEQLFTMECVNQIYKGDREITNIENVSNLSTDAENEKRYILKRWQELTEQLNSYDYYVQLRRREFGFYYNIPDGETHAAYDSRSNVFVIQLFGLVGAHDPRRIFRFLMTAFAAFPNKDYCLLSINVAQHMTVPLFEMLKYFIRVTQRPDCRTDEQLFITHRSAVYGDISVFPVRPEDEDDIKNLLKDESSNPYPLPKRTARSRIFNIADRISFKSFISQPNNAYEELTPNEYDLEQVSEILENIFDDPFSVYKCFTIRCGDSTRSVDDNKLVGFVIVRPFHYSYYLKKHYHVNSGDEYLNFFKAELVILKLHQFFCFNSDLIFHELARQTHYYHFYYIRPTDQNYLSNDLVANMQPLEPRRIKKLWFNNLAKDFKSNIFPSACDINKNKKPEMINTDLLKDNFVVFTHNLRPSIHFGNSTNIVILGFTDICKAFLRLMIFSWHNLNKSSLESSNCLPQLNITVICGAGVMEADHEHSFKCKTCCKDSGETCWINFKNSDAFIRDVCDRLDVRTWIRFVCGNIKTINTDNQLIKMETECEVYYEILLIMCATEFGVPDVIFKNYKKPPNYSHINNRFDKILFYHKLQILFNDLPKTIKKSIIVYGNHVRAFEFVNFLLQHKVKGGEIHFVMPYLNLQLGLTLNNSTQDTRIEAVLREMMDDLGVQIYEDMVISSYTLQDDDENLKDITFKKYIGDEQLTLECDLFVSFYEVFLPRPLLEIFKDVNIDTDQNFILVNENYQTSVPKIFALGNYIKHTTEPNHQYRFVSTQEAAEKIINILDLIDIKDNAFGLEKKYSKPSYFQAQLPMDYTFIKVITPKRYLANHLDNEYVFPLVTYHEGDFCRVRLNLNGMVEEIVVVTQKKIDFDFLKFFCGRHELLLNNLKSRWYLKEIVNFIDFFQEPWTELLMHGQFENLRLINKLLILDAAKEVLRTDMDLNSRCKLMYNYCRDLGINRQVEYALLQFIRDHREDFCTDIALPEDFATK